MTTDHEAREAAAKALGDAMHGAGHTSEDDLSYYRPVASAAIDAYNAKLQEGVAVAFERFVESFNGDEAGDIDLVFSFLGDSGWAMRGGNDVRAVFNKAVAALSAQRQDHTELIAQIRSEANIADRPGQFDRLNAIANALEGKSDE